MSWLSGGWKRNFETPYKRALEKNKRGETPFSKGLGAVGGDFGHTLAGVLGMVFDPHDGWMRGTEIFPSNEGEGGGGTPPLKTHVAGQANNFGRFGDISQQAPGGWIRKQQKNRYGRASTILTRGTSRKAVQNRKGG